MNSDGLPRPARPVSLRPRLWLGVLLVLVGGGVVAAAYFIRDEMRARDHENEAHAAIDRRDFKLALQHLQRCRDAWPRNRDIAFLTARTARRADDLPAAERHLNEAERLGYAEQGIFLERALLLTQQGGLQSAEGFLLHCVRNNHPDSVLILEIIAPAYLGMFNVPGAVETLRIWMQLAPNDPAPQIHNGDLLRRLNRKNEALAAYQEACRLAPENAEAREKLSGLLVETKNFAAAVEHLDWLILRKRANRVVYLDMASCRAALGEESAARAILEHLLKENPDDAGALSLRGRMELEAGNPREAELWLRKAIDREPFEAATCYNLARCLEQLGKADEAKKYRERFKQIEDSIVRLSQIMRLVAGNPGAADLRYEAGMIMIRNGQLGAGLHWLETALKQDSQHVPTHQALADLYQRAGDLTRANVHRRLAGKAQ